MEIVDIVLFNNELELLDLRVKILEDVVDVFIVKEATQTFQGNKKEMLARTYNHPKVHVVEFDFPEEISEPGIMIDLQQNNNTWAREKYQRGYRVDLEKYGVSNDAIVLTSDLDEIPNPEALKWLKENFDRDITYVFELLNHQYYLNVRNITEKFYGTRACSVDVYGELNEQEIREQFTHRGLGVVLPESGWHWTFLGGPQQVSHKINSYAHTEFNNYKVLNEIGTRILNNQDVFDRGFELITVPIDESYPNYIVKNQDTLSHLIRGY